MKVSLRRTSTSPGVGGIALGAWLVVGLLIAVVVFFYSPRSWWLTPDQQAQRLFERGEYAAAAPLFSSAQRRGEALFRAGQFEAAASEFARVNSAQGHFNRGNALVMRGNYADAISAYQRAVALQADWPEAVNNLQIARLRAEQTRQQGGDMTGGMLGADEVVFSSDKSDPQGDGQEQVDGGKPMSDAQLQALWLRRVQTRPAAFMRAKFAFQLARQTPNGAAQ